MDQLNGHVKKKKTKHLSHIRPLLYGVHTNVVIVIIKAIQIQVKGLILHSTQRVALDKSIVDCKCCTVN